MNLPTLVILGCVIRIKCDHSLCYFANMAMKLESALDSLHNVRSGLTSEVAGLIGKWIMQQYVWEIWQKFKNNEPIWEAEYLLNSTAQFWTTAECSLSGEISRLCSVAHFLMKVSAAMAKPSQNIGPTVIEDALEIFKNLVPSFGDQLNTVTVSEIKVGLRYHAVLSCCHSGDFQLAAEILNRQWRTWVNSSEFDMKNELESIVFTKTIPSDDNTLSSVMEQITQLFDPVMESRPFLQQVASTVQLKASQLEIKSTASACSSESQASNSRSEDQSSPTRAMKKLTYASRKPGSASPMKKQDVIILADYRPSLPEHGNKNASPESPVILTDFSTDVEESPSQSLISDQSPAKKPKLQVLPCNSVGSSSRGETLCLPKKNEPVLFSDFDEIDAYDDLPYNPTRKKAAARGRRKWLPEEEELIYKGVQKYGLGSWSEISKHYLPARTNVDIKDKWRNLMKQGRLTELNERFGPIW